MLNLFEISNIGKKKKRKWQVQFTDKKMTENIYQNTISISPIGNLACKNILLLECLTIPTYNKSAADNLERYMQKYENFL